MLTRSIAKNVAPKFFLIIIKICVAVLHHYTANIVLSSNEELCL